MGINYTLMYVISGSPVNADIANRKYDHCRVHDASGITGRPDVAVAQVKSGGRSLEVFGVEDRDGRKLDAKVSFARNAS